MLGASSPQAEKIAATLAGGASGGALAALNAGDVQLAAGLLGCAAFGGLAAWLFARIDPSAEPPVPFAGRIVAALVFGVITIGVLIDRPGWTVWHLGTATMIAGLIAWPMVRLIYRMLPGMLMSAAGDALRRIAGGRADSRRDRWPPEDR